MQTLITKLEEQIFKRRGLKMVKIYIDPGHGGIDPGAVANGLQEKNITLQISKELQKILVNEYENVSVKLSRNNDETVSLQKRTDAANRWGADLYVSIHINAGGGTGFESFIYPRVSQRTRTYQKLLHNEILQQVDFTNRGEKQANFHVLRATKMPAILTENGFIDTKLDVERLKNPRFIKKLARGHANGIAKALNLSEKVEKKYSGRGNSLYKVQIGAFANRENAERLAEYALKLGFNVYIIEE